MKKRLYLVLMLLGAWVGTAGALTSISAYKTFTREVLTSSDLNNTVGGLVTGVNAVIAKFPGDSVKVGTGAMDTLVANPGPSITVKSPLFGLDGTDTTKFFAGNYKRLHIDSLNTKGPVVAWAFDFSAGSPLRAAKVNTDTLAVRGTTSGTITVKGAAAAGTYTLTLPTTGGTTGYPVTTTDGAGTLTLANQLSLTAGVTGVLPVANGGTNASSASITSFNNITGYTAAGATGTTSTNLVFSTSPNLTTPTLTTSATTTDNFWIGLGSGAGRIEFDDQATDEINFINCLIGIGTSTPTAGVKLDVFGADKIIASNQGIVNVNSTDSMAIDLGGSLGFGGSYTGTSATTWANISGRKENATDNNVAGYLAFATRPAGGSNTERMRISSAGNVFINDTSNANSTLGLTINQGANDDEALSLKSSDVAHGLTSLTETDTYAKFAKFEAATGGLLISGYNGGASVRAISLQAIYGSSDNTSHDATASGGVMMDVYKSSGTSVGSVAADANLFVVRNGSSARFIVDADGDLFADGSAPTIYDGIEDDVALISAFDKHEAKVSNQQIIESEWEDYTRYNEKDLIEMGLIGGPRVGVDPSKRGLINYTGMVRLHNGAIRQVGRSVNELDHRTETLAEDVAYLKAVHGPDPTWDDVETVMLKWLYSLFGKGN